MHRHSDTHAERVARALNAVAHEVRNPLNAIQAALSAPELDLQLTGGLAGTFLELRYVYGFKGGTYYNRTNLGSGWYIDTIAVSQAEELTSPVLAAADSSADRFFQFVPDAPGDYALRARAWAGDRLFQWGPAFLIRAVPAPPQIRFRTPPLLAGNRATLEFELSGGAASGFTVETAPSPTGPWLRDPSANIQTLVPGSRFRATATAGDGRKMFYRVELSPAQLLDALQGIEQRHGRERPYPNAPRTLDLDLLTYGDMVLDSPMQTLPHPRMHQRAFVLQPLLELDPRAEVPGRGPAAALLAACAGQRVERLP